MKTLLLLVLLTTAVSYTADNSSAPKLVLVIVVDQFAYHELQKLESHFKGGIKFLRSHGLSYEYAYVPHGVPQTSVGHTSLSTGALPKDHGIISNAWYAQGKLIKSDEDNSDKSAVFKKDEGTYAYGKSSLHNMVDTLSDQHMLRNSPQKRYATVALSLKSQASIALAGKLGLALWIDDETGWFTTSKAYAAKMPTWVKQFNEKRKIDSCPEITWKLMYPENSIEYQYNNIKNYTFTGSWGFKEHAQGIAGTRFSITKETDGIGTRGCYEILAKTPIGAQLLTDFARACIDEYADHQKPDHFLLWVSLSGLDKVAHPFGPDSLEAIDMLYHIDRNIQEIITHAYKRYNAEDVLIVLTADHGVVPIPEYVHAEGYLPAHRIITKDLVEDLNRFIEKKFSLKKLVIALTYNNIYLNHQLLAPLKLSQKENILQSLKKYLVKYPGIKQAWTQKDLLHSSFHLDLHELEAFCRNQIFPLRSGDIFIQVYPYTLISDIKTGTDHTTPYDYDTHIPLMVYQKGKTPHKKIMERVWIQQVAPTISHFLHIPRPSACPYNVLPGIFPT